MPPPTVFISYSHKDEPWKQKLLPHLHALERAGVPMTVWHDRKIDGGDKWYPEIEVALANAAVGVLLISPDFLASGFINEMEVPYLIKRQEEHGMLLLPVLVRACPWKAHRWLKDRQMLPRDGKCIAIDFPGDQADGVFSDVASAVYLHFDQLAAQPQKAAAIPAAAQELARAEVAATPIKAPAAPAAQTWPELPGERVDLTHLPETGAALFGRDEELSLLDKVWTGEHQPGDGVPPRVLAFKAQGGVGKSTLINHWLAEMRRDHFRGATRAFGWSFYSQGVREHGAPSADTFVAAALRFFGDEAMAASPASAWEKGERLARLVSAERALLVLDGMEPLQSAQPFQRGKLQDPALESLLRGLARHSAGLCIITTREPLAELGRKAGIVERDLEQITPQAGRALLRALHVVGTDVELEALAERFGPHALAISLLGVYLHEQPGRRLGPAEELEKLPGQTPVDRVLAGFEQWLGPGPELEALRLLGFFDRPADEGCLRALREPPAIPGLTDALAGMTDPDWHRLLARLEKLRLIHIRQSESGKRFVDTHPLIREHFAACVREHQLEAWRAAHRRLYEHLCATTPDKHQPTLEDLEPLYQAVAHGCEAGLHVDAGEKVYRFRIHGGGEGLYSLRHLGAFGMELGMLSCFFGGGWGHPAASLPPEAQGWLLNQASLCLKSLGRTTESLDPVRAALAIQVQLGNYLNASIGSGNLSLTELRLGRMPDAISDGRQAVAFADRSADLIQRVCSRTTLADVLNNAGDHADAMKLFREAEALLGQANYSLLYSEPGFAFWDCLLAESERAAWRRQVLRSNIRESGVSSQHLDTTVDLRSCYEVKGLAEVTLQWVKVVSDTNLDVSLNHLTLGRVQLYEAILVGTSLGACETFIEQAVSGLRRAGTQDHLPRGLFARAWLRFLTGARIGPDSAQADLDEAWEIAERGPMRLFLADIHLHRARLFFREEKYPWESPEADLKAARDLIEKCGYGRRMEELKDAEAAILGSGAG